MAVTQHLIQPKTGAPLCIFIYNRLYNTRVHNLQNQCHLFPCVIASSNYSQSSCFQTKCPLKSNSDTCSNKVDLTGLLDVCITVNNRFFVWFFYDFFLVQGYKTKFSSNVCFLTTSINLSQKLLPKSFCLPANLLTYSYIPCLKFDCHNLNKKRNSKLKMDIKFKESTVNIAFL